MLPVKFQDNWHFISEKEEKNRFSRLQPWRSSWISHRNKFHYSLSTSHPVLPAKFQVNWHIVSGEEEKNRFSRQPQRRLSWIADRKDFNYFLLYETPGCFLSSSSQLAFWFRRRGKLDFQDSSQGEQLGFSIRMILAMFDLQVTSSDLKHDRKQLWAQLFKASLA